MFATKPTIVNLLLRFGSVLSVHCCNPLFTSFCCLLSFHGRKSIKLIFSSHFPHMFVNCAVQKLSGIFIITVNSLINALLLNRLLLLLFSDCCYSCQASTHAYKNQKQTLNLIFHFEDCTCQI